MKVLLCILCLANGLSAAPRMLGGYSGWVERMGAGPREAARGNTGVADSAAQPAAFWNPALLPHHRKMRVVLHGESRQLDRQGGSAGFSAPVGNRMGIGMGILYRRDADFRLVDEDDLDFGSIQPYFMKGYLGLGWRLSRRSSLGASFTWVYENFDIDDLEPFSSPVFFDLGWYYRPHKSWQFGVVARNLGFEKNLSARFYRTLDRENRIAGEEDILPKTLELGATWTTRLAQRPLELTAEVLDYQLADSLLVFDFEKHALRSRLGLDWRVLPEGHLRTGYDAGSWTVGLGWTFHPTLAKRKREVAVDYALQLERNSGFVNPASLGVRFRW